MCLPVPMRIIENKGNGFDTVDLDGTKYNVNLSIIEDPRPGDYVIVHAGFAIEKLDREDADSRLAIFERMAQIYRNELGKDVSLIKRPERGKK